VTQKNSQKSSSLLNSLYKTTIQLTFENVCQFGQVVACRVVKDKSGSLYLQKSPILREKSPVLREKSLVSHEKISFTICFARAALSRINPVAFLAKELYTV